MTQTSIFVCPSTCKCNQDPQQLPAPRRVISNVSKPRLRVSESSSWCSLAHGSSSFHLVLNNVKEAVRCLLLVVRAPGWKRLSSSRFERLRQAYWSQRNKSIYATSPRLTAFVCVEAGGLSSPYHSCHCCSSGVTTVSGHQVNLRDKFFHPK